MIRLTSISILGAALALAGEGTGWRSDPQHPQLEYRVSCDKGDALSILWRNGYPGEVSLKAHVKSFTYDGFEDAKVLPGKTFKSDPDTMSCSLGSLIITVMKFKMAPAPVPAQTAAAPPVGAQIAPEQSAAPVVVPTLIRFEPQTEKLPEITPKQLGQIAIGMKREEVIAKLGPAASKIATENDGAYVESYRYRLGGDKIGFVRFSNGFVTEITVPQ